MSGFLRILMFVAAGNASLSPPLEPSLEQVSSRLRGDSTSAEPF